MSPPLKAGLPLVVWMVRDRARNQIGVRSRSVPDLSAQAGRLGVVTGA